MPGVEDWINGPMPIVQRLFDGKSEGLLDRVEEYFSKKLEDKNALSWIPSLNSCSMVQNLRHNSLVRFRCMVQDTFDPEFYLGVYEVADLSAGGDKTEMHSGMFKDIAECRTGQEIRLESARNVTMDRQTLYCVPVPGENEWVKKAYSGSSQQSAVPSSSSSSSGMNRCKRPLDDEEEPPAVMNGNASHAEITAAGGGDAGDSKKPRMEPSTQEQTNKKEPDLNFPLPGEKGPACIVKLYNSSSGLKVNDTVEFIGILSNDPAMANFKDPENTNSAFVDPESVAMETEEESAHCPPPSLVPRLHVILTTKLQHSNPLLPTDVHNEQHKAELSSILREVTSLRQELLGLLQHVLCGDKMAAEYMLCHLVSSVYARQDVIALGKFALNLSGLPRNTDYACRMYSIIQQLVAKSHYVPMTLETMNDTRFVPCKDYSANRLVTGVLQLSDRTHLVLDETTMQPGQLDSKGVKNITAIGNVINWQKIEYDFNFHKQDFFSNIICLVLSEGKSLLKCDCRVHVQPTQNPDDLDAHFKVIEEQLTSGLLTKLRLYIGLVQLLKYDMPEELQKEIEGDFVDSRKDDPKNMSVDDFHTLLVLARLLSLTHGRTTLSKDVWERAKTLEIQRKIRLASL